MEEEDISEKSKALLRDRQGELIKILDALVELNKSKEWSVLKELVFDRSLSSIERQLFSETLNSKINSDKIYKLQGERDWAKRFTDIDRYVDTLKKQLEEIKKQLK